MMARRLPALGLAMAAAMSALALSGCNAPEHVATTLPDGVTVVAIPPGAYDSESGGPWYLPSAQEIHTPGTIRWVNNDIALHRVLAFWEPVQETPPMWVQTAQAGAAGHSHAAGGGHDHSAMAGGSHQHNGTPVFDVTIEAGQTLDMPFEGEGRLMVHCHPHPWMINTWTIQPGQVHDYGVNVSSLVLQGRREADTGEGATQELEWSLGTPNLAQVSARLDWDDSLDDVQGQSQLNQPDTLGLELVAPDGTVVASSSARARLGQVNITYDTPMPTPPATVGGVTLTEARQNLSRAMPDWLGASGAWKIRVTVLAAPGALDNVTLPATIPGADGAQAWVLHVQARHVWGTLGSAQDIPIPANPK